jgi:hypothetical protein
MYFSIIGVGIRQVYTEFHCNLISYCQRVDVSETLYDFNSLYHFLLKYRPTLRIIVPLVAGLIPLGCSFCPLGVLHLSEPNSVKLSGILICCLFMVSATCLSILPLVPFSTVYVVEFTVLDFWFYV